MVNEADYSSMQLELFDKCEYPPGGYILDSIFSKTSKERFQAMKEWTFAQSLNPLQNVKFQYLEVDDGRTQDWLEADDVMLGGESSMLNILEAPKETSSFPKEGEGYGLSQILEKSTDVPKKYFLSAKACQGIINRSERRNKVLPPILKKALEMQAGITHDDMSTTGGQNGKAYAIGNGQVHQLYLQDNCGALNCMQDRMKVMQEIGTDNYL